MSLLITQHTLHSRVLLYGDNINLFLPLITQKMNSEMWLGCRVALFVRQDNTVSKATDHMLDTEIWIPEVIFSVQHADWLWNHPVSRPSGTGICSKE
jgi:hypothetical protein